MSIVYRRATANDIPALIQLEKSVEGSKVYATTLEVDEWMEELHSGKIYIIEKDGDMVGDFMYEIKSPDHAYIGRILVDKKFQGQGIAKGVMGYLLKEVGNIKRIDLVTHPDNYKAIRLYTAFNFVIESRKENYFGDGEPRVVMVLLRQ